MTPVEDHSFEFDARLDSQDVDGGSKHPGASPPEYMLKSGKVAQQASISGKMLRGDDLYVKWRIRSTNEIFEDTVNLKDRLPSDINGHRIRFIVQGPQLYVYLISPEKQLPNPCPSRDELRRMGN